MLIQILVKWLIHKDTVLQAISQRNQAIKLGENIKVDYYFSSRSKNINTYWIFKNNISQLLKVNMCITKNDNPNKQRTQKNPEHFTVLLKLLVLCVHVCVHLHKWAHTFWLRSYSIHHSFFIYKDIYQFKSSKAMTMLIINKIIYWIRIEMQFCFSQGQNLLMERSKTLGE